MKFLTFKATSSNDAAIKNGLWTLTGIVIFFLIEKLVPDEDTNSTQETQSSNTSNAHQRNDAKNSIAIKKLVVMSKTNKNNKRKFWLFESFKVKILYLFSLFILFICLLNFYSKDYRLAQFNSQYSGQLYTWHSCGWQFPSWFKCKPPFYLIIYYNSLQKKCILSLDL